MEEVTAHHVDITPDKEQSSSSRTNLTQPVVTKTAQWIHRAVLEGDWKTAKSYCDYYEPVRYNSIITRRNETVLHIAVTAPTDNLKFVEEVAKKMSDEALETRDDAGNTAFFVAIIAGNIEVAKVMKKRKPDLAMIRGGKGELPLYMAASRGYTKMARWLYQETKSELEEEDKMEIFVALISSNIYDVALQMMKGGKLDSADRITCMSVLWRKPVLFALAQKMSLTCDPSAQQDFPPFESKNYTKLSWKNFIYAYPIQLYEKHIWKNYWRYAPYFLFDFAVTASEYEHESSISEVIDWNTISIAVQNGNAELLFELSYYYPDLLSLQSDDGNRYTIFHLAVLHRQEDIFRRIHQYYSIKEKITWDTDKEGNNMLHLAAKFPVTSNRLLAVSGPALQMQLELLWYKEVEKVVPFTFRSEMNKNGKTPGDVFVESHKDLLKEAESWMRGTADKCMLVATLVATVVFSAAFQLPGAVNENGNPNFLRKTAFKFFFMADAVSLVSSVASVMIFLGLMTSKYQIHDFRLSLPRKLIIGLGLLFISLASMLMAFVATTFLVFNYGNKDEKDQLRGIGLIWFAIPIAVIGAGPIILFIWMHLRLFMDAWIETVNPKSIFKPNKVPFSSSENYYRHYNYFLFD